MTSTDNATIDFFHGAASLAPWSELELGHICMATCIFLPQCGEHKKGIRLGEKTGIGRFPGTQMFYHERRFKRI